MQRGKAHQQKEEARREFAVASRFVPQVNDPKIYSDEQNPCTNYYRPTVADIKSLPRRYRPREEELRMV